MSDDLAAILHLARSDLAGGETTPYSAAETRYRLARALVALAERLPTCSHCSARPAACLGCYEGGEGGPAPACDVCCGHGNEDGWCVPIAELPAWAAKQRQKLAEAHGEIDQLRAKAAKLEQERDAELARIARLYEQLQDERERVAEAGGVILELRAELERLRAGVRAIPELEWTPEAHERGEPADYVEGWNEARAAAIAVLDAGGAMLVQLDAGPVVHAPSPERAAEIQAMLAAINRASQQLVLDADDPGPVGQPTADSLLVAQMLEQLGACLAEPPAPGEIQLVPIASVLTPHERIAELETALRGLVARVDRAGGYASPEEQDVLRRARQVLGGAGAARPREGA